MFCLGKDYPVYIDQRAWSLYSNEFYAGYLAAAHDARALESLLSANPVTWAVTAHDAYGFQLSNDPAWRLVWFDDKALVFARVGDYRTAATIAEHEIRYIGPVRLVGLPDLPADRLMAAREELARVSATCADCYRVQLAAAGLAIAAGDDAEFLRIRDRLLAERETTALAYLSGRHALRRGDTKGARELFQRYRELGGEAITATIYEAMAVAAGGDVDAALQMLDPARAPAGAAPLFERARRQIRKE
jgi:hypothetical protein